MINFNYNFSNKILYTLHKIKWVNLKNITLSKRNQTPNCMQHTFSQL